MTNSEKTVIFGGNGFIGGHIAELCAQENAEIICVSRRPDCAKRPLPAAARAEQGDASDAARVRALCEGADTVINAIGVLYENKRLSFMQAHAEIPALLARAAKEAGVRRFVHISALGADNASPSAYARSKAEGETRVRGAFPEAVILRPSVVFGPEDNFFNQFAAMAKYSPALPLIGGGSTLFQPVYVKDIAQCAVRAGEGAAVSCGGPDVMSFKEILQTVCRITGRKRALIPLPFSLAKPAGALARLLLPKPPLTDDQVILLQRDNTVPEDAFTLQDCGITPATVRDIVPGYLR